VELEPRLEHALSFSSAVVCEEQGRHGVKKVLVVVQVLLVLNQVELELLPNSLTLQILVARQINDQLVEKIIWLPRRQIRIVLKQRLELWLERLGLKLRLWLLVLVVVLLILLDGCLVIQDFYLCVLNS